MTTTTTTTQQRRIQRQRWHQSNSKRKNPVSHRKTETKMSRYEKTDFSETVAVFVCLVHSEGLLWTGQTWDIFFRKRKRERVNTQSHGKLRWIHTITIRCWLTLCTNNNLVHFGENNSKTNHNFQAWVAWFRCSFSSTIFATKIQAWPARLMNKKHRIKTSNCVTCLLYFSVCLILVVLASLSRSHTLHTIADESEYVYVIAMQLLFYNCCTRWQISLKRNEDTAEHWCVCFGCETSIASILKQTDASSPMFHTRNTEIDSGMHSFPWS